MTILSMEGNRLTEYEKVKEEAVRFYQSLFAKPTREDHEAIELTDCIKNKLTEEMCSKLAAPVTVEEIRSAMFKMKIGIAPVPNGYTVDFYIRNWNLLLKK